MWPSEGWGEGVFWFSTLVSEGWMLLCDRAALILTFSRQREKE
jgi:hypothetical protein